MKKTRRDDPIRVTIHIFREMSQGNSLCRYLKQAKISFLFPPTKSENREEWNSSCLGVGVSTSGRGKS
jgi:hypothetical protein